MSSERPWTLMMTTRRTWACAERQRVSRSRIAAEESRLEPADRLKACPTSDEWSAIGGDSGEHSRKAWATALPHRVAQFRSRLLALAVAVPQTLAQFRSRLLAWATALTH